MIVVTNEDVGPDGPDLWAVIVEQYRAAIDEASVERYRAAREWRIPYGPGQCAPAIGVHAGCEHDR